jgi:hypothetical protein
MAKAGFEVGLERYNRRDPVTGQVKLFERSKHARQSSPRLVEFKRCVRDAMEGYRASGATPQERAQSVRMALAAAAERCRRGGGR